MCCFPITVPDIKSKQKRSGASGHWRQNLTRFPFGLAIFLFLTTQGFAAASDLAQGEKIKLPITNTSTDGKVLASQVCGACHLCPDPEIVDKKTWREQILPRMETRLGVSPPDYTSSPEGQLIKELKIYPEQPLISKPQWDAIFEYYVTTAPEKALPQDPHPAIEVGLPQFEAVPGRFRFAPALTTFVKISPATHSIILGDDQAKIISILDVDGKMKSNFPFTNVPIAVVEQPKGMYVTSIGSFAPSEVQRAGLSYIGFENGKAEPEKIILKDLPRAVQTVFADFNRDGKMDFATCMFGNLRGRFSWFENTGADAYKEHVLFDKTGPIHCEVHDFNHDGIPDIALLVAQETEALYILLNDGKGNFGMNLVFQKHPAFGHNYFELADFNGDGEMDLLVVNGDNGEYPSPMKKFHGVRIYLNKGNNHFEESYFFPLNGAIKAVARDFDGDGDLDIAAISFFPDYEKSPRESFVYLENTGGMTFKARSFAQCVAGRWDSMDVGDLDGDGDLDIVLGSYIRGPTPVPDFLKQAWEKQGPSIMILKNKLRVH
jgi:hypothetical protein